VKNQYYELISKHRIIFGGALGGFITGLCAIFFTQCVTFRALIAGAPAEYWFPRNLPTCFLSGIIFSSHSELSIYTYNGGIIGAVVTGIIVGFYTRDSLKKVFKRAIIADSLSSLAFVVLFALISIFGSHQSLGTAIIVFTIGIFVFGWLIILIYAVASLILACSTSLIINRIFVYYAKLQ
jgi:hypothetical protein